MIDRRVFGAVILLAAGIVVGCGGDSSPTGGGGTNQPPPGANVAVGDNFFTPANFAATVGNAVVWQWAGSNLHNVTFNNGDPGSNTQNSGTFSRTFTAAGTFDYHCSVHGAAVMSGTVTVTP